VKAPQRAKQKSEVAHILLAPGGKFGQLCWKIDVKGRRIEGPFRGGWRTADEATTEAHRLGYRVKRAGDPLKLEKVKR
jgi:hypothetical protein